MAFPQSFSTTAECPFMENSPSTLTVRLSTSCTPIVASASRFVSFSSELEAPTRPRALTESDILKQAGSPPPSHRNKFSSPKMTTSVSVSRTFSSGRQGQMYKSVMSNSVSKPELESSMSWFGRACEFMRPWEEEGDELAIPEEQKQAFVQTRDAVSQTLKRMVKCTEKIALEVLVFGMETMEFIPDPILQGLAKTFLSIWKAVQQISMNRLAILRLTQTCSNILESICNEVEIAGDQMIHELSGPILVLEKSFESFLSLVESQVNAPFLARYLKRDETSKTLTFCNESMMRALTLFTNAVQIRTLAAVCANSRLQDAKYDELKATIEQAINGQCSQSPKLPIELRRCSAPELDSIPSPSSSTLGISASPTIVSRSTDDLLPTPQVVPALQELQTLQNLHDEESDIEDLERTIKGVLNTGDDTKLLAFLGVKPAGMPDAIKTLQRTLESRSIRKDDMHKDVLHQEFLECGVEALRRLTSVQGNNLVQNLPAWTITSLEIILGKRIGIGSFSEVYQGTWKGRAVAVKFLSDVTPYDLFIREITVWKGLRHPNVLTLFGASSATDNPPWFFVSPYMENNTLVHFLKHLSRREEYEVHALGPIAENLPYSKSRSSYGTAFLRILKAIDVYRILQQIARGMEYLHCKGILHGDLKGANVLVDKHYRCVISDFGQSEMKSEVYRITGSSMQTGTLRWKAPELLDGSGTLTPATDVYAYAIVCIEVLTMGDIPWGQESDDAVRINVLEKDKRPIIPLDYSSPLLHGLIESCWVRDPEQRSLFGQAVARLERLKQIAGDISDPSVMTFDDMLHGSPTLGSPKPTSPTPTPRFDSSAVFGSIDDYIAVASTQEVGALQLEESATISNFQRPEAVQYIHRSSVRSSKTSSSGTHKHSEDDVRSIRTVDTAGPAYPLLDNDGVIGAMNERRYRYLLEHEYNASLTLPLWEPTLVQIGDVGYLRKPTGVFVTLFNALKAVRSPRGATNSGFANMAEFGNVSRGNIRMDKRTVAQKGMDAFSGFLSFRLKNEPPIARRHSFRLRAGHKCAYMHIEGGDYLYMKRLDAPKAWFQVNADRILSVYGQEHNIQKEDLLLVISLLQAPNYALFVSHNHPEGHVHFNVYAGPKKGRPWGKFVTHTSHSAADPDRNGPSYDSEDSGLVEERHENAVKVSKAGDTPKAVLIGRLRFKPDGIDPTTSK